MVIRILIAFGKYAFSIKVVLTIMIVIPDEISFLCFIIIKNIAKMYLSLFGYLLFVVMLVLTFQLSTCFEFHFCSDSPESSN